MAEGPLNAIGLVSGVLGIVGFFQSNFAEKPKEGSVIRVKAGLAQGDEDVSTAGKVGAVYGWDVSNNYQGKAGGSHIGAGSDDKYMLEQFDQGRRIEYAGVSAEKDAICIAWITVTMHDGTNGGAWTGDIGSECDQVWYHSAEKAGKFKDSNEDYIPRCTWLDEDHSGDTKVAAMKFATGAYGEKVEDTVKNKKQCDSTKWGPDNGPISAKPGKRSTLKPRHTWMENRLVVSKISQHKAADLCNSATSWGPDFVGSDGYFCDMHTKTMTPVCSFHNVDGCINVNTKDKTTTKRFSVAKRQVEKEHKSYGTISQWD